MDQNAQKFEKTVIKIQREDNFFACIRKFKIIIDDELAEKIRAGDVAEFIVDPGEHEIYVKLDWMRSRKIRINNNHNEISNLICGTVNSHIFVLLVIFMNIAIHMFKSPIIGILSLIIYIILTIIPSCAIDLKEE